MPSVSRSRRAAASLIAVSVAVAGLVSTATAASAVSAPGGLGVVTPNSSTPILSWGAVSGATGYEVQVDNDSGFGSPEFSSSTANVHAVPTKPLKPGTNHWRVRAKDGKDASSWVGGEFSVSPVDVPVPVSPADGATLPQPSSPPLLRWETSRGATSYLVEVDGDADFIGADTYTTKTTSIVVPDPLIAGDYFWRVTALKTSDLRSTPSATRSFVVGALPTPQRRYPTDSANFPVEDVVLDWNPVPGAANYDLQVALDGDFNNIALDIKNIKSTRYSPPTTLGNDQFWWRVRAVDLAGQPTPWAESVNSFKRQWPDQATLVYPPTSATPLDQPAPFYQWTPVQHATRYELVVSTDEFFSTNVDICETVGTTYVPRKSDDCGYPGGGATTYWKVRPIDDPYPGGGLPGVFSSVGQFSWNGPAATGVLDDLANPVTGQKVALTGTGATCSASNCAGLTSTPVLSWNKYDGATYYKVYFAQDENFTTSEITNSITTNYPRLALRNGDQKSALPDNQAGLPYFWYVQPCTATGCGPSPVSTPTRLPGTFSFEKKSPAVTGLKASNTTGHDVIFTWHDYATTNAASTWNGTPGQQTARDYVVQVDDEPSFTSPRIDEATVDQATYTGYKKLYPEGTLYVRVQARDGQKNALTWSNTVAFTKSSPPVRLASPVGGASVSGTTPFQWAPQSFAASYRVEVYRNADTAFSPSNRVFSSEVKTSSYAYKEPLPASTLPYVWRVRAKDASGNEGSWSATGVFYSRGDAPQLLAPASGSILSPKNALFQWSEVTGAASYDLEVTTGTSTKKYSTVASAYAPTSMSSGDVTWRVTANDAAGRPLGTSSAGTLRVDGVAPKLAKLGPKKVKRKSTLKAVFSERVFGASTKTVKVKWLKEVKKKKGKTKTKKKAVKVKVKVVQGGLKVKIDPKKKLKKGDYVVTFKTSRIHDVAGLSLETKSTSFSVG